MEYLIQIRNDIKTHFLLASDNFMHEIHLMEHRYRYSAFGPFPKYEEEIQKFKATGDLRYIYQNELVNVFSMI